MKRARDNLDEITNILVQWLSLRTQTQTGPKTFQQQVDIGFGDAIWP